MNRPMKIARLAHPHTYAEDRLGLKLHPKQAAVLRDLFKKKRGGTRVSVRCSNEVGKTTHLAAPAILYAIEMLNAQAISTAGVWMQVKDQLIPALKQHSHHYPELRFLDTSITKDGVPMYVGFSTREEGFAQGFHRQPARPLLGIVDEAAAVQASIINGIEDRCNPDYFLVMGSPLDPSGMFYDIETKLAANYSHHKLNQMECLTRDGFWIEPESIERKIAKWGRDNPFVQSNVFGEFSSSVEGAVITLGEFDACINSPPSFNGQKGDRHAFFDFAGGRAKNVFALRVGNRVWIVKKWVDVNTMSACGEFLALFKKIQSEWGLQPHEIDGDADGLGLPMLQRLAEMGLTINKFHGGSAPRFEQDYANAISEAWGEGAGKMKRKEIIAPDDPDFKAQCLSRKLKRNSKGKFQLESKEDLAARGMDSPDEADALLSAMMPTRLLISRQVMGGFEPVPHTKDSFWGSRDEEIDPSATAIPGAWCG
jgi:hypothetical protein